VQADPRRYVSHVITPASRSAPPGFQELTRVGRLTIWRRGDEWRVTDIVPGWEPRIHALKPIPTPPSCRAGKRSVSPDRWLGCTENGDGEPAWLS